MEQDTKLREWTHESTQESELRKDLTQLLRECPIEDEQLLSNLGLFIESKNLARILFMNFLFRKIVDVHGSVIEFGTRWGQNLALFAALRGIYDPFNRHRKIIGFDTFAGFPSVARQDGRGEMMAPGNVSVTQGYDKYLTRILEVHEALNPLSHIKKFELRIGDATVEIDRYLKEAPETIVALAYFDFDIYEPTKKCIEAIRPRLTKGSVVAFDELNDPDAPGETLALMETLGLNNVRLRRFPRASRTSYIILE
ncbi:MAG: crotonobetainyl-CoA--carnitine CoA-transferase [Candidatus Omnitrophica bacterium]|nr:crotonobetainyl-CoA--carnitine CoA-transferase [Candidatus Omnitrophota bacterium]